MKAFRALTYAQWKGFLRDKQTLFWTLGFPLMFLFVFGFIFSDTGQTKSNLIVVGNVPLVDNLPPDGKAAFNQLFKVTHSNDEAASIDKVKKGKSDGLLEMQGDNVLLRYSQADRVKAATVQGTIQSFVQNANVISSGVKPKFNLEITQVEDKSLKSIQFLAPGLLGWAIGMAAVFGSAMPLVQWRTNKLLRRLRLSPASVLSIVMSRSLVALGIAIVQFGAFVGIATTLFGLKLTGPWWMALPLVLCATICFQALGLIAGSISKTVEAASGYANILILPMAFLSGSFIPLDIAPPWVRTVSKCLPLNYLNQGMLDVMVRNAAPTAALLPMAVLLGFAVVFGAIALSLFRWES